MNMADIDVEKREVREEFNRQMRREYGASSTAGVYALNRIDNPGAWCPAGHFIGIPGVPCACGIST